MDRRRGQVRPNPPWTKSESEMLPTNTSRQLWSLQLTMPLVNCRQPQNHGILFQHQKADLVEQQVGCCRRKNEE